jgi:hypothetical protein
VEGRLGDALLHLGLSDSADPSNLDGFPGACGGGGGGNLTAAPAAMIRPIADLQVLWQRQSTAALSYGQGVLRSRVALWAIMRWSLKIYELPPLHCLPYPSSLCRLHCSR